MTETTLTFSPDDRLNQAIAAFEDAQDAGLDPTATEWLLRYSDVAEALRSYFADVRKLRVLAGPIVPTTPLPDIPDYEIIEPVAFGIGGMGMVFKARRKSTQQIVALKVIRPDLLDNLAPDQRRKTVERFITEARVAALLEHQNIVKVYDVGESQGRPYYSMRYVEGKSLSSLIKDGIVPPAKAAVYIEQVARAVHVAHQHGIIHRDLKPNNILIDSISDGPLVADFGLAKLMDRSQDLTQTHDVMGAPPYMSPEQAQSSARVTTASDVYALGATLYALLTGRPPFRGDTPMATLQKVLEEEPMKPRELNSMVSLDLETICLKCLEKEPQNRYANAAALAEDLQSLREGMPINARQTGLIENASRWCRRNQRVAILLMCLILSLLGGTAFSTYFGVVATHHAGIAKINEAAAKDSEKKAKKETEKALGRSYASALRLIEHASRDFQFDTMRELLEGQRPIHTGGLDFRGFEWHYWRNQTRMMQSFRTYESAASETRFSADGAHLVQGSMHSKFGFFKTHVWNTLTEKQTAELNAPPCLAHSLAISNDGNTVALANFNAPELWSVATNKKTLTLVNHRGQALAMVFSPNGKHLAIASAVWDSLESDYAQGEVKIWDTSTGKIVTMLPRFTDPVLCLTFCSNGRLATGTGRLKAEAQLLQNETGRSTKKPAIIQVWDTNTSKLLHEFTGHDNAVTHVAFDPNTERLVSAARDQTIRMWALNEKKEIYSITQKELDKPVRALAFHPNGDSFATIEEPRNELARPGPIRVWTASTGKQIHSFDTHNRTLTDIAFRSNGQNLVSIDVSGLVQVFELNRKRDALVLNGTAKAQGYNPKTARLTIVDNSMIKIWDLRTQAEVTSLRPQIQPISAYYAIGGEGRYVAVPSGNKVTVWDTSICKELYTYKIPAGGGAPVRMEISYGVPRLAISVNNVINVWDLASGRELLSAVAANRAFYFSEDGHSLGIEFEGKLHVWDLESGHETVVGVFDLLAWRFSALSRRFIYVLPHDDRLIARTMDVITGNEVSAVTLQGIYNRELDNRQSYISPDGRYYLAVRFSNEKLTLVAWDLATGRQAWQIPAHPSELVVQFDSTSKYLAVNIGVKVRVLQVATGSEVCSFYHHRGIVEFGFSSDSKRIVTRDLDYQVKLWDTLTGQEVLTLQYPTPIRSFPFFTPDESRLLLPMTDSTIIWDGSKEVFSQ